MKKLAILAMAFAAAPAPAQEAGPWSNYTPPPPAGFELDRPAPGPFEDLVPKESLGAGPHTLVISDGDAMTRMEYKTGKSCQKARDEVRRQNTPKPTPGIIYASPRVRAFCVPR